MRKVVTVLLSLVMMIVVFAFIGCGSKEEAGIEEEDGKVKVRASLYSLNRAYELGKLSEDDLKSISCYIYDKYSDGENPYSGLYEEPDEQLDEAMMNELKQAYLNQIDKLPNEKLNGVSIHKYLGIYGKYLAVSMTGYGCGFPSDTSGTEIGGVTFCNDVWSTIYIYQTFKPNA